LSILEIFLGFGVKRRIAQKIMLYNFSERIKARFSIDFEI
jgi:hypothetical protein